MTYYTRPGLALLCAMSVIGVGVGAAGCSSDAGDEASKFVGTWTFDSGMVTPTCGPPLDTVGPVDLTNSVVTVTKVDNGNIRIELGGPGCRVSFAVSGSTATAGPGQTCMLSGLPVVGTATLNVSSWTFTLANGALTTMLSGTALVCQLAGSGVLTQHGGGPDAGAGG